MRPRSMLLYCDDDDMVMTTTFATIIMAEFPHRIPVGGIVVVPRSVFPEGSVSPEEDKP